MSVEPDSVQPCERNSLSIVRKRVFWPPFTLLIIAVVYSFYNITDFLSTMTQINNWILIQFDWLFSYATLCLLLSLIAVYFSPLGKIRIGGSQAEPLLTKWRWFSITLCTTLATGILFWAVAEPMYHVYVPPVSLDLPANSDAVRGFTMATMFMHWSFSPYAIYCVPSLVFALCYHNMNKPFTIGTSLDPAIGEYLVQRGSNVIDSIALFALVAGMSASLGTGILVLSGGIEAELNIENGKFLMAVVTIIIVFTFVLSAVSGLQKGMARLSSLNAQIFVFFCLFVFIFGPTTFIVTNGLDGLIEYVQSFMARSVNQLTAPEDDWSRSWTIFYFANWYAWAPIAALFLGRIARGYTVKQFIQVNLILPSCCAIIWMSTLSGAAIHLDGESDGMLRDSLLNTGPESVIYTLFDNLPMASFMTLALIVITFISFVTAADSNTDAMSRLCTKSSHHSHEKTETSSIKMKLIWGTTIGTIAWVMVSFANVDGIKMMTSLGGLPALLIIMLTNLSLFVLWKRVVCGDPLEP
ncbi:BCCT family transporter [Aliiglaciecola sp.]|nr:BCCT family transporter [Aliiglaciecola sp.]